MVYHSKHPCIVHTGSKCDPWIKIRIDLGNEMFNVSIADPFKSIIIGPQSYCMLFNVIFKMAEVLFDRDWYIKPQHMKFIRTPESLPR